MKNNIITGILTALCSISLAFIVFCQLLLHDDSTVKSRGSINDRGSIYDDEEEDFASDTSVNIGIPQAASPAGGSSATISQTPDASLFAANNAVPSDNNGSSKTNPTPVTVLVYMNGSNLETESGEATTDMAEMAASMAGTNVNILVETLGTRRWHDYGISGQETQIYQIKNGNVSCVRNNMGQLDSTAASTLADFISWGSTNYPAERYILIFWNHGGGPVYGFGYDEWQSEDASLTIDEIQQAMAANPSVHFDIIGMDCCIMASLETCCAFASYCDYTVLAENFESGLGWEYTTWMSALEANPQIASVDLGTLMVDSMVNANKTEQWGDSSAMGVFRESSIARLYAAWVDFAYENEATLLGSNFSRLQTNRTRQMRPAWREEMARDYSNVTMSDYYVTDLMAVAESVNTSSDTKDALASALSSAIVYFNCTDDVKDELTGLSISLPYGDSYFYSDMRRVFLNAGFDSEYVEWLGKFVNAQGSSSFYDYSGFENSWGGWDDYYDDYDWQSWDGCNNWDDSCSFGGWYDDDWYSDDWYYYDDYYYDDDWYDYDDYYNDGGCYDNSCGYDYDDYYYNDSWYDYDDYYYDNNCDYNNSCYDYDDYYYDDSWYDYDDYYYNDSWYDYDDYYYNDSCYNYNYDYNYNDCWYDYDDYYWDWY